MHIDRHNFAKTLPQVLNSIQQSDFVSFDCQFSGLVAIIERIEGIFPNHVEFYERIKQTANNFALFQVGISAFIYKNNKYMPKVYNFYLDPKMRLSQGYNNVILCQVESIEFLAKNGMDFKRIFMSGIKSNRIYGKNQPPNQDMTFPTKFTSKSIHFDESDQKICQQIEKIIHSILNDQVKENVIDFKTKSILIYFRNKYPQIYIQQRAKNMKPNQFIVRKGIKAELQQQIIFKNDNQNETKEENQQKDLQKQYGFEIIIKKIIECKKPIVGHFPNLDLGLIFNSFIQSLPEQFKTFCEKVNSLFPYIFDTKIIARRIQNKLKSLRVDLASLFKACFNQKLLKHYANINFCQCQKYLQSENYHQAGYDAFITGCSFIGMINYIFQQKDQRINFKQMESQNKILYSRFTGEISLIGPIYCPNAQTYDRTIILGSKGHLNEEAKIADILKKYGTLSVYEDHSEIYYVFDKQPNIQSILQQYPELKLFPYQKRRIIKASQVLNWKSLKEQ